MHVVIAVHGFPPTHSAGAELQAERMARWLIASGHRVTVFAVEELDTPAFRVEKSEQEGFGTYRLHVDANRGNLPSDPYDYPPVGQAFGEVLNTERPDLVHVVSGYLLGGQVIHAGRAAGLPVVITLTEYWFMCARLNLMQPNGALCSGPESDEKCMRCLKEEQRRYRLPAEYAPRLMDTFWEITNRLPFAAQATRAVAARRETLRAALDAADLIICPSRFLIRKFAEFGFDTRRFVFMRQGLSTPAGRTPDVLRPARDGLRLGYIGQIKAHKGVDLIVDAVIRLLNEGHQVSLHVWGTETEEPAYVTMLKKRSAGYPAIVWNGQYRGAKVWEVLAGLDALVVPSRWYENSPTVILEAFEMKLPVVATNLGGMAELVEHEKSGLLFGLNDVDDLHRQLRRLLTEADLLERLRANVPSVKAVDDEMDELMEAYGRLARDRPEV